MSSPGISSSTRHHPTTTCAIAVRRSTRPTLHWPRPWISKARHAKDRTTRNPRTLILISEPMNTRAGGKPFAFDSLPERACWPVRHDRRNLPCLANASSFWHRPTSIIPLRVSRSADVLGDLSHDFHRCGTRHVRGSRSSCSIPACGLCWVIVSVAGSTRPGPLANQEAPEPCGAPRGPSSTGDDRDRRCPLQLGFGPGLYIASYWVYRCQFSGRDRLELHTESGCDDRAQKRRTRHRQR